MKLWELGDAYEHLQLDSALRSAASGDLNLISKVQNLHKRPIRSQ